MCVNSSPFLDFIGGNCICAQSLNGGAKLMSRTCRPAALVALLDQACCRPCTELCTRGSVLKSG